MQLSWSRWSEMRNVVSPRRVVSEVTRWVMELGNRNSRESTVALQIVKATGAAVVAWVIAVPVLGSQAGWLAPMTAVLAVQATVYRSVADGTKRVAAVGAGALLATTAGHLLGFGALALAVVVPIALAFSRWRGVGAQGEYVPVTAVVLLTFGVSTHGDYVLTYVGETALGAVVGMVVNAVVFPPQYLRDARAAVRETASETSELLDEMAKGMRRGWEFDTSDDWMNRSLDLQTRAHEAQSAVDWGRESRRWNPRGMRHRNVGSSYQADLDTLWHVVIDVIAIARTLREIADSERTAMVADEAFNRGYGELLHLLAQGLGQAAQPPGPAAAPYGAFFDKVDLRPARSVIERLDRDVLEGQHLGVRSRVTSGELLLNARRLLDHTTAEP